MGSYHFIIVLIINLPRPDNHVIAGFLLDNLFSARFGLRIYKVLLGVASHVAFLLGLKIIVEDHRRGRADIHEALLRAELLESMLGTLHCNING